MTKSEPCIISTTTNNKGLALDIAGHLVELELASCVQIDQCSSVFKWDGKLSEIEEFRLSIKAAYSNYKQIEGIIKNMHSYELPEIIVSKIDGGSPEYLSWIAGTR